MDARRRVSIDVTATIAKRAEMAGMAVRFPYDLDVEHIDFRARPDLYEVGRGEQGVLLVEPYKSELLPFWAFRTPETAAESAGCLFGQYLQYRARGDFVGMDMARKFIQIGFTRSRRYANWHGGRKYGRDGTPLRRPRPGDSEKAESAAIFKALWDEIRADPDYRRMRAEHERRRDTHGMGGTRHGT